MFDDREKKIQAFLLELGEISNKYSLDLPAQVILNQLIMVVVIQAIRSAPTAKEGIEFLQESFKRCVSEYIEYKKGK